MKEQQNHFEAFELAQCASKYNQKILYLCSSDKEARLVKHELELYLPAEEIAYYPKEKYCRTTDSLRLNLLFKVASDY